MEITKICNKCFEEKNISEFYKKKGCKDGLASQCKECTKQQRREQYKNNPEYAAEKRRYSKWYRENNLEHCNERDKKYHQMNKDRRNEMTRKWREENKDYELNYRREYRKEYYKRPEVIIARTHRSRCKDVIIKGKKCDSTINLLGAPIEVVRKHLEEQFVEGMSWENHGEWHIDHIQPCASFDLNDPEQQRECFHYTNLQPLWALDNLRKGSQIIT